MKALLYCIINLFLFCFCGPKTVKRVVDNNDTTLSIVRQKGKVSLPNEHGMDSKYKFIELGIDEALQAQQIIKLFLETNPVTVEWDEREIDKEIYQSYYKQFSGLKNELNQTVIWVNCSCQKPFDWEKTWNEVQGGGICFFNAKVNLETDRVFDFFVNGPR